LNFMHTNWAVRRGAGFAVVVGIADADGGQQYSPIRG
jgi:hypothetical protein